MDNMFREVHRSNMTKVCSTVEDAKESIDFYLREGKYKNPSMRVKGKYFVVYDAETTKILKCHKWETPNLKQFF
jgi:predicted HAD superfamily Cof-like phosphohydrolase